MKRKYLITLVKRSCAVFALTLCGAIVLGAAGCGSTATTTTAAAIVTTTTTTAPTTATTAPTTATTVAAEERTAAVIQETTLEGMTVVATVKFEDGTTAPATFDLTGNNTAAPGMQCVVVSRDGKWVIVEVK